MSERKVTRKGEEGGVARERRLRVKGKEREVGEKERDRKKRGGGGGKVFFIMRGQNRQTPE